MGDILPQVISNGLAIAAGTLGYFRPADAAKLIGTVLVAGGSYGYLAPKDCAIIFGIPFATQTHSLFFPAVGGRNAAAGLTSLILSFNSHRPGFKKALGVVLGCWTLAGFSDCGILASTEGSENMLVHARNICILTIVSWRLLTSE